MARMKKDNVSNNERCQLFLPRPFFPPLLRPLAFMLPACLSPPPSHSSLRPLDYFYNRFCDAAPAACLLGSCLSLSLSVCLELIKTGFSLARQQLSYFSLPFRDTSRAQEEFLEAFKAKPDLYQVSHTSLR